MNQTPKMGRVAFVVLFSIGVFVVLLAQLSWSFSQGPNNRNVSVDTQVNVTGSAPDVLSVIMQNPITLNANSLKVVSCNASIRDYNGISTVDNVHARFFHSSSSLLAADDNNTHYSNANCTQYEQDGIYGNYTCNLTLTYYATNGTWNCTIVANDSSGLYGNNSNRTNISAMLALNVTTLIDYGQMNIGDTSTNQTANVTNVGNVPINVSVSGYGRTPGDGLGFVCEQGNLTVGLQHFSLNISANYTSKQNLTSAQQQVMGLTVPKPQNDSAVTNTTYWQLYLNPGQNVFGLCNGTIVFQAETA